MDPDPVQSKGRQISKKKIQKFQFEKSFDLLTKASRF